MSNHAVFMGAPAEFIANLQRKKDIVARLCTALHEFLCFDIDSIMEQAGRPLPKMRRPTMEDLNRAQEDVDAAEMQLEAQQTQWNTIMSGIQTLAPHLIRFLDKGKSGAELAEFVIENADEHRTSYERIKHLADSLVMIGVQVPGASDLEKFMNAARFCFEKVPNLWAKVGTLPTMPQFLAEFFNYDEILAEAEKEETK